jgi:hypothetical protein
MAKDISLSGGAIMSDDLSYIKLRLAQALAALEAETKRRKSAEEHVSRLQEAINKITVNTQI